MGNGHYSDERKTNSKAGNTFMGVENGIIWNGIIYQWNSRQVRLPKDGGFNAWPTLLWILKFCLVLWALFVTNSFVSRVLHLFCSIDLALQETIWKGVTKPSRSCQYWMALTCLQRQCCCQLGWRFIFLRTWAWRWGDRGGLKSSPSWTTRRASLFSQGAGFKGTFLQAKRVIL